MQLLIRCGLGLESICVWELHAKLKDIAFNVRTYNIKGYIKIEIENINQFNPRILQELRCFEKVSIILDSDKLGFTELKSKRILETKLRNLIENIFESWQAPADLAKDIKKFEHILKPNLIYDKEFNLIISKSQKNLPLSLTDSQIYGIINRVAASHGFKLNLKSEECINLMCRISINEILILLDLPLPPGNFKPKKVHPTGIFPNFIFGLIIFALSKNTEKEGSKKKKSEFYNIIDPFMGSGAILRLIHEEQEFLIQNKLIDAESINYMGIEIVPQIYEDATTNLKSKIPSENLILLNQDFRTIKVKNYFPKKANLIITQPPYGHSIKYQQQEISQLYHELFNWSFDMLNDDGILTLITPREELIQAAINQNENSIQKWILVDKMTIKQHSLDVGLYIYKKGI
jgi:hypothetical protein